MLFGSLAGVFVDRWDRKRSMVVAHLAQAAFLQPLLLAPDLLGVILLVRVLLPHPS